MCWDFYRYDYQQFNAGKVAASKADLVVTKSQRETVLRRMRRDTEWLVQHHLMDSAATILWTFLLLFFFLYLFAVLGVEVKDIVLKALDPNDDHTTL